MTTVYYSLLPDPDHAYADRLLRSVTSLRAHNPTVPVVVCVYGDVPAALAGAAAALGVDVVACGGYAQLFAETPARWHDALARNPTLHKLASLRVLTRQGRATPLLFLDCDTHLAGDVEVLAQVDPELDFMAREEPCTRRSPHGYDPRWVDEDRMAAVAAAEGVRFVPPYNCGVFRVGAALAGVLDGLFEDFLWYVWRLLVGAATRDDRPDDTGWLEPVERVLVDDDRTAALPYAASTTWLVEPLATWLLLGRMPDLRHGTYPTAVVAQNGEYRTLGAPAVVTHYFSVLEGDFLAHLAHLDAARPDAARLDRVRAS